MLGLRRESGGAKIMLSWIEGGDGVCGCVDVV